jgi:hypothetical protein
VRVGFDVTDDVDDRLRRRATAEPFGPVPDGAGDRRTVTARGRLGAHGDCSSNNRRT